MSRFGPLRWRLRCLSVDGVVRYEAWYSLRRTAFHDAGMLASPFYDVVVTRRDGAETRTWPGALTARRDRG